MLNLKQFTHMKKLMLLIAAFVFVYHASHAQTEKGTQTLGANLGFTYTKYNDVSSDSYSQPSYKETNFSIGPTYSYFIADKLDLGASVEYSSNVTNYIPNVNNEVANGSSRNYGGTIYLRKYFMYSDKLGLRTGIFAGYYRSTVTDNYIQSDATDDVNSKSNSYDGGVSLELVYYPTKHVGVSASLASVSYSHSKTNNDNQDNESVDNVNFDFINNGLTFSVFYAFGGK